MSEFPEWVERELGCEHMSKRKAYRIATMTPDPRGTRKPIWWRQFWPFDRRGEITPTMRDYKANGCKLLPQPNPDAFYFDGSFLREAFQQATNAWQTVCLSIVKEAENS